MNERTCMEHHIECMHRYKYWLYYSDNKYMTIIDNLCYRHSKGFMYTLSMLSFSFK